MDIDMDNLRERTLKELFSALEGVSGSVLECRYYPCHFEGQDCTFCYCPFYPCLIYDTGGRLKGDVWSCMDCTWVHERENVEKIIEALSIYPRQKLVEEDWHFFNVILQILLYGSEMGTWHEGNYNLLSLAGEDAQRSEMFLAVKIQDFQIVEVLKSPDISSLESYILVPLADASLTDDEV
jgi:hypothetical protein